MYVVSCRKGFESDAQIGAGNLFRNYKNPADPTKFDDLDQNGILDVCRDRHIAILVHGYNNEMHEVMGSYWKIVSEMQAQGLSGVGGTYRVVLGFTWPGMAIRSGYFAALSTARKAGPFLAALVHSVRTVAKSVDVQTHSLGARVALTALKDPNKVFLDNLLLSAPAVDNHVLEPDKAFHRSLDNCNRCFVYHSKNDPVLKTFYKLGDVTDGIQAALGLRGPRSKPVTLSKTPNLYVVDCAARVTSHGGYKDTPRYFEHWKQLLAGGPMSRYDELS
jgi:esterase/lipase superfamily enzyme